MCLASLELLAGPMYDPFQKTAKASKAAAGLLPPPAMLRLATPPAPTVVTAVMNDKAYINGAWYRVGDRVNDQEVAYIRNDFVGLKEGNRLKMIAVGTNRRVLGIKDVQ